MDITLHFPADFQIPRNLGNPGSDLFKLKYLIRRGVENPRFNWEPRPIIVIAGSIFNIYSTGYEDGPGEFCFEYIPDPDAGEIIPFPQMNINYIYENSERCLELDMGPSSNPNRITVPYRLTFDNDTLIHSDVSDNAKKLARKNENRRLEILISNIQRFMVLLIRDISHQNFIAMQPPVPVVGGKTRKTRKTKKTRKTRKTRKTKKTRKTRKMNK